MNAIKEARRFIAKSPATEAAKTLADLVISLESGQPFALERIYQLDLTCFELAIDILKEWRLDRYYAGKSKLLDVSMQARTLEIDSGRSMTD